jgi:hypothetical protein
MVLAAVHAATSADAGNYRELMHVASPYHKQEPLFLIAP